MTRFLSVLAGLGLLDISFQSLDPGNNILFLFFSSNKAVAIARLILGAFIIFIAFKGIKHRLTYKVALGVVALLIAFPFAGIAYPQITYSIYNVIKPLDYLISWSFGLILAACVLEIEPPKKTFSWPRIHLPRLQSAEFKRFIFNSLVHSSTQTTRHAKRARA